MERSLWQPLRDDSFPQSYLPGSKGQEEKLLFRNSQEDRIPGGDQEEIKVISSGRLSWIR